MELNLQIPKIVELDLSGEHVDSPFPLLYIVAEEANKHILTMPAASGVTFQDMLDSPTEFEYYGAKMWDDTVKEFLSQPCPETLMDPGNTVEDYLNAIRPTQGESPVDVDTEVVDIFLQIVEAKQIVICWPGNADAMELHGPFAYFQLNDFGSIVIGVGPSPELPLLPDSYTHSLNPIPAYTTGDVGFSLIFDEFLVKGMNTGCSESPLYSSAVNRIISDDNVVVCSHLWSLSPTRVSRDFELYASGTLNYLPFFVEDSLYYFDDAPVMCDKLLTEAQARELYPDFFPPKGLEATKKNKIIAR